MELDDKSWGNLVKSLKNNFGLIIWSLELVQNTRLSFRQAKSEKNAWRLLLIDDIQHDKQEDNQEDIQDDMQNDTQDDI